MHLTIRRYNIGTKLLSSGFRALDRHYRIDPKSKPPEDPTGLDKNEKCFWLKATPIINAFRRKSRLKWSQDPRWCNFRKCRYLRVSLSENELYPTILIKSRNVRSLFERT